MDSNGRAGMAALLAAGTLLTGACAPADEARGNPVVPATPHISELRMAFTSRLADSQVNAFQSSLSDASTGQVSVRFPDGFDSGTHGIEQEIVRAVADGRLDLGLVGARAFSELGVHELDALVAPMVLDSRAAQGAVLTSDLPQRMLAGLEPLGVQGLAVLGGPLRRPVTAGSPLTTVAAFRGVAFYSWHGDINAAAVAALGATNVDVSPRERNERIAAGSIRAYEGPLTFLADNADWKARTMTVNVNLWPSVSVLLANPSTLAALPLDHREAVHSAAADTASRALDLLPDEDNLAADACRAGARLAAAQRADLAEIADALQSVVSTLRRNPTVSQHLDEIDLLTTAIPPDTVAIPAGCAAAQTKE